MAPVDSPARRAISLVLAPSKPRSAKTATAASSSRALVSAALSPAMRPTRKRLAGIFWPGGYFLRHDTRTSCRSASVRSAARRGLLHGDEQRRPWRRSDVRHLRVRRRQRVTPAELVGLPGGDEELRRELLRPRRPDRERLLA